MYKIVGGDKKEYGPVTAEQIRDWIVQGRANAQTLACFEGGPWKPLATFPEFASLVQPVLAAPGSAVYGQAPRGNALATAGLTFSILGLVCCGVLGATIGIICSAIALTQIRENPARYTTGPNVPIAGIVVGVVVFVLYGILYYTGFLDEIIKNLQK